MHPSRPSAVGPLTALLMIGLALLCGCGHRAAAAPIAAPLPLDQYHYAVVSVRGHTSLEERASSDLRNLDFIILGADDPRLHDPAVSASTLSFTFVITRSPPRAAMNMMARDTAGREVFHSRAQRVEDAYSLDAAILALAPYRHAEIPAPAPGSVIEF